MSRGCVLMLQDKRGERGGGLADVDAMIVQADRGADDAAEAHIALRADQAVHLHRDEAAQREDAAVAEIVDAAPGLLVVRPRAGVAFALQIGASGVVEVVVELPGEDAVGIHHLGEGLLRGLGLLLPSVQAVLLAHHVERLQAQALADVGLRRQMIRRAELGAEMVSAQAVRGVRRAIMHGRLQMMQQAERVRLAVVEDDLPLLARHQHEVLHRCAALRGLQRVGTHAAAAAPADNPGRCE